jgi:hypothetical protein
MELVWNILKYNFMLIMKELVSSYFIPVTTAMKEALLFIPGTLEHKSLVVFH